jgi:hypothetical protein
MKNKIDDNSTLPDLILPFKISKEEFYEIAINYLSHGDYTPVDILTNGTLEKIEGYYLPVYFYNGTYFGNWAASSGYERYVKVSKWSETQNKYVTKTKVVTDWMPSSGNINGSFSILGYAGLDNEFYKYVAKFSEEAVWKSGELLNYNKKYIESYNLVKFGHDIDFIWGARANSQADEISKSEIINRVPGDTYEGLDYDVTYNWDRVSKISLPAWILFYNYDGAKYYFICDGTDKFRNKGERPVDKSIVTEIEKNEKQLLNYSYFLLIWFIWGIISYLTADSPELWIENHYSRGDGGFWYLRNVAIFGGYFLLKNHIKKKKKSAVTSLKDERIKILENYKKLGMPKYL